MGESNGERTAAEVTSMRITRYVRDYLTKRARKNESLDSTLRRLLKLRRGPRNPEGGSS